MAASAATTTEPITSPRVRAALRDYAANVRERFGPRVRRLTLFGSQARGDAGPESDTDVLVVLDEVDWPTREEVLNLAGDAFLAHEVAVAPVLFDAATYAAWREQERPLVMDVEREGIDL